MQRIYWDICTVLASLFIPLLLSKKLKNELAAGSITTGLKLVHHRNSIELIRAITMFRFFAFLTAMAIVVIAGGPKTASEPLNTAPNRFNLEEQQEAIRLKAQQAKDLAENQAREAQKCQERAERQQQREQEQQEKEQQQPRQDPPEKTHREATDEFAKRKKEKKNSKVQCPSCQKTLSYLSEHGTCWDCYNAKNNAAKKADGKIQCRCGMWRSPFTAEEVKGWTFSDEQQEFIRKNGNDLAIMVGRLKCHQCWTYPVTGSQTDEKSAAPKQSIRVEDRPRGDCSFTEIVRIGSVVQSNDPVEFPPLGNLNSSSSSASASWADQAEEDDIKQAINNSLIDNTESDQSHPTELEEDIQLNTVYTPNHAPSGEQATGFFFPTQKIEAMWASVTLETGTIFQLKVKIQGQKQRGIFVPCGPPPACHEDDTDVEFDGAIYDAATGTILLAMFDGKLFFYMCTQ